MKRPEITNRLLNIIRKEAPEAKVILYGSEARGDAQQNIGRLRRFYKF